MSPAESAAVDKIVAVELQKTKMHFISHQRRLQRDRCCLGVMNEARLKGHEGNKSQASDPLNAPC